MFIIELFEMFYLSTLNIHRVSDLSNEDSLEHTQTEDEKGGSDCHDKASDDNMTPQLVVASQSTSSRRGRCLPPIPEGTTNTGPSSSLQQKSIPPEPGNDATNASPSTVRLQQRILPELPTKKHDHARHSILGEQSRTHLAKGEKLLDVTASERTQEQQGVPNNTTDNDSLTLSLEGGHIGVNTIGGSRRALLNPTRDVSSLNMQQGNVPELFLPEQAMLQDDDQESGSNESDHLYSEIVIGDQGQDLPEVIGIDKPNKIIMHTDQMMWQRFAVNFKFTKCFHTNLSAVPM